MVFAQEIKSWEGGKVGESGGVERDQVGEGGGVVGWSVAGSVEGGEAGGVFGEFVSPEVPVGLVLGDPVARDGVLVLRYGGVGRGKESGNLLVHVGEEIIFSITLDDFRDWLSGIRRHRRSTRRPGCSIWRWSWIVLATKVYNVSSIFLS